MKLSIPFSGSRRGASLTPKQGFTLPEVLIAMTVFIFLLGGVLFAHLFGLRMFQINETKLNATTEARKTIGKITDEIRASKNVSVGNMMTNGDFAGLLPGETQEGTALRIEPGTNEANFIYYFVNPADQTFRRTLEAPGTAVILAESITNHLVFRAQDLSGKVLTDNQNNRVIHINLEFYQPQRFFQGADYYKLETSVTRRVSE